MSERYELIYGFVHCLGRTTYSAGCVDSRTEAEAWLKRNQETQSLTVKVPSEDPIRYCKAALCPFKRQKPWFEIRDVREPEESE